jgi:hypothetical protein
MSEYEDFEAKYNEALRRLKMFDPFTDWKSICEEVIDNEPEEAKTMLIPDEDDTTGDLSSKLGKIIDEVNASDMGGGKLTLRPCDLGGWWCMNKIDGFARQITVVHYDDDNAVGLSHGSNVTLTHLREFEWLLSQDPKRPLEQWQTLDELEGT